MACADLDLVVAYFGRFAVEIQGFHNRVDVPPSSAHLLRLYPGFAHRIQRFSMRLSRALSSTFRNFGFCTDRVIAQKMSW